MQNIVNKYINSISLWCLKCCKITESIVNLLKAFTANETGGKYIIMSIKS